MQGDKKESAEQELKIMRMQLETQRKKEMI